MPPARRARARAAGSLERAASRPRRRSHPERLRQSPPGRPARLEIQTVDDREPKAPGWHRVGGGWAVGVKGDLHAAHIRHAPHLLDHGRSRMLVFAAVRAEQGDTVAVPAVALVVATIALPFQAYHGRQPAGAVQSRLMIVTVKLRVGSRPDI